MADGVSGIGSTPIVYSPAGEATAVQQLQDALDEQNLQQDRVDISNAAREAFEADVDEARAARAKEPIQQAAVSEVQGTLVVEAEPVQEQAQELIQEPAPEPEVESFSAFA